MRHSGLNTQRIVGQPLGIAVIPSSHSHPLPFPVWVHACGPNPVILDYLHWMKNVIYTIVFSKKTIVDISASWIFPGEKDFIVSGFALFVAFVKPQSSTLIFGFFITGLQLLSNSVVVPLSHTWSGMQRGGLHCQSLRSSCIVCFKSDNSWVFVPITYFSRLPLEYTHSRVLFFL